MKRNLVLFVLLASVAACNTIGGVGRDISSVGDTVSDAAK
jgi:predicted small secreted protein